MHDDGVHLCACDRLSVAAHMQPLSVDDFGNLLCPHPTVGGGEHKYNGFFNFHSRSTADWIQFQLEHLVCGNKNTKISVEAMTLSLLLDSITHSSQIVKVFR